MNSDNIGILSPPLPPSILYPATFVFIVLQMTVFWRVKDRVANFVIFAVWFRYVIAAYHFITYKPLFAGMSLIAFCSAGIVVLGVVVIRPRHLLMKFLVPCYILIAVVIISGLANNSFSGIISVTLKYGYFVVVMLAVFEALNRLGEGQFMSALLWAFIPPLVLQGLSIIFGIYKATEGEGSASFIGGYDHEATFSIILATCFIVACMNKKLRGIVRNGILLVCLVGIYFANYRTTMIAIAPMAIAQFTSAISSRFRRDQRAVVGAGALVAALGCVLAAGWFLQQRFEDVSIVAESRGMMIKPPAEFSVAETRTMSGRPYIWSTYLYAYLHGSVAQHLIGFGPESWSKMLLLYAHNTLVSYLYEYGVVGVIAVMYWWGAMAAGGWRLRYGPRTKLLAAHVTFILLNMATMPLWMIEGNILYGIIGGYTLYLLKKGSEHTNQSRKQQDDAKRFGAAEVRLGM